MHSMLKYQVCLNHFEAAYTDFSPHPRSLPSSWSLYSALSISSFLYAGHILCMRNVFALVTHFYVVWFFCSW